MTNASNGWPDAEHPGVPINPERDGWHWLTCDDSPLETWLWRADLQEFGGKCGGCAPIITHPAWRYAGPCLTPAEVAALVEAARREEREACAAVAVADPRGASSLCPYLTDGPGDPTWTHTEQDICPVCGKPGGESGAYCTSSVAGRIAAAIRARGAA